ncbi:MAG TPA: alpha/beta fold hydrolase [Rhodothermales bacterium]|nr:alpha/beta fold hydrolase [Rhodothermales bacterium]
MVKRIAGVIGVLLVVVLVLFLLGPKAEVDGTVHMVDLPEDLDAYLAESEAQFADLHPDVEKTIVWADSSKGKTPLSVIYLHGFSATRQEVRPFADTLAARLGANLFYTRLTGHGRTDDAMGEATVNDWLNDTVEALRLGQRLGKRVIVVGTSTGATLGIWLAAQQKMGQDLMALVFISPNFALKDPNARLLLWPWGKHLATWIIGPYRTWTPHNEEQRKYWTTRYPSHTLVTMMSLVDYVNHTDLGAIQTPTLVIYSPNDQVIDAEQVAARFVDLGSGYKRLVAIEEAGNPSNHVLAGDILSPNETLPLVDTTLTFLAPLLTDIP